MPKLSIGGMEKALVDLLNLSNLTKDYTITLYLGYKGGNTYLNKIPKEIDVVVASLGEWSLFNKMIALTRMTIYGIKLFFQKYDVSICYAHQHGILATLSRLASKNSIIFVHTNLTKSRTKNKLANLIKKVKFENFKKIICISNDAKHALIKLIPNSEQKIVVIHNYINGEEILANAQLDCSITGNDKINFINVSRHVEGVKKISRIISSAKKLAEQGYNFKVTLVGDGDDTPYYKKVISENNLGDYVCLVGRKSNPYNFMIQADYFILSSKFEGYPIVFNECFVLNLPIITTDVSDAKVDIDNKFGIVVDNSEEGIYLGMKKALEEGVEIKEKFDFKKHNEAVTIKIKEIIKRA